MARPPWAICAAAALDAAVGAGLACLGTWWTVAGVLTSLEGGFLGELGLLAVGWGLAVVAGGAFLLWVAVRLWKGAAWAQRLSAVLALGLVPGSIALTVWVGQGALLMLVAAGPALAIGLFLPRARRHVGTAPAEGPAA